MTSGFDLGHDLELEFLRSNIEFTISQPKIVRLPRNESKHINWTLGLKCDHRVWPWPWHWPWIFTKWKANILIEIQASNVTNGFYLDHNLDLWILKVECDLSLGPHTWPWSWIFMVKIWNSRSQNGRADWHCIKGVAVGHSWPWPWPFSDQGQVYGSTR